MSNVTGDASTAMDIDYQTKATFCDQVAQTDLILVSYSSAQYDDPIDYLTPITPTGVNTFLVSDDMPHSSITFPCYRLGNSHKYCGSCKAIYGGRGPRLV